MTHTPGPWTHDAGIIRGPVRGAIASIPNGGVIIPAHKSADEAAANARLISACPDMLAALRSARLMLWAWRGDRRDHTELNGVIADCEAAIAKATSP